MAFLKKVTLGRYLCGDFTPDTPICHRYMLALFKTKYDDAALLDMIGGGGSAAEKALMWLNRQYAFLVPNACKKHSALAIEDAEEAFDDALLALRDNIAKGKFQGESSIKTYFNSIFERKCIDKLRQRPTMQQTLEIKGEPSERDDAVERKEDLETERIRELQRARCLEQARWSLSEKEQDIAVSAFVEGMKPRDLATKYGYKDNKVAAQTIYTIKNKLIEAIQRLCKTDPSCQLLCQPGRRITLE